MAAGLAGLAGDSGLAWREWPGDVSLNGLAGSHGSWREEGLDCVWLMAGVGKVEALGSGTGVPPSLPPLSLCTFILLFIYDYTGWFGLLVVGGSLGLSRHSSPLKKLFGTFCGTLAF